MLEEQGKHWHCPSFHLLLFWPERALTGRHKSESCKWLHFTHATPLNQCLAATGTILSPSRHETRKSEWKTNVLFAVFLLCICEFSCKLLGFIVLILATVFSFKIFFAPYFISHELLTFLFLVFVCFIFNLCPFLKNCFVTSCNNKVTSLLLITFSHS